MTLNDVRSYTFQLVLLVATSSTRFLPSPLSHLYTVNNHRRRRRALLFSSFPWRTRAHCLHERKSEEGDFFVKVLCLIFRVIFTLYLFRAIIVLTSPLTPHYRII